jgi:hypothetical protein
VSSRSRAKPSAKTDPAATASPLLTLLLSLPQPTSTTVLLGLAFLLPFTLKSLVSLGSFSGKDAPPRYGDFEAQRFWMELTLNEGIKKWYYTGEDWWQLDCKWIALLRNSAASFTNFGNRRSTIDGLCQLVVRQGVSPFVVLHPVLSSDTTSIHSGAFFLPSSFIPGISEMTANIATNTTLPSATSPSTITTISTRGASPPNLITYMRATVLALESVGWWIPVAWWCWSGRKMRGRTRKSKVSVAGRVRGNDKGATRGLSLEREDDMSPSLLY